MTEENKDINQDNNNQSNVEIDKSKINTGLISLEVVAKINNIDIDMRAVVREFGVETADISMEELVRIAKNSGFKIKKKNILVKNIAPKYPFPAIVQMKDNTYSVLLGVKDDGEDALILSPPERHPKSIKVQDLQEQINPEILILKHKLLDDEIKFGFKWFFSEIIKYKHL